MLMCRQLTKIKNQLELEIENKNIKHTSKTQKKRKTVRHLRFVIKIIENLSMIKLNQGINKKKLLLLFYFQLKGAHWMQIVMQELAAALTEFVPAVRHFRSGNCHKYNSEFNNKVLFNLFFSLYSYTQSNIQYKQFFYN